MAFTEFCCRNGGSNMNGGGLASGAEPATTPVYSATNGGWNSGTGVFTPTSGDPSLTVTVGDWANVFIDGATTPVFVGRVTAVTSTTITVSTSAKGGTAPTTAGTGISINVGGAWKGPNGAVGFPYGLIGFVMSAASGNTPRVNLKNDQTYSITAGISHTVAGPMKSQGYTSTFGDGGFATIDGGTSGASYVLFTNNNAFQTLFENIVFQNNGATGSASVFSHAGGGGATDVFRRCVFAHSRGNGFEQNINNASLLIECEAYDCNQSNTASKAGFFAGSFEGVRFQRCYSHNHVGSNSHGFFIFSYVVDCIADSCGGAGFIFNSNSTVYSIISCDAYNCGSDGIRDVLGGGRATHFVENCNLIKNNGWGINFGTGGEGQAGWVINCGFGSGSQVNVSGMVNNPNSAGAIEVTGSIIYASNVTPYNAPTTGDFRIALAAAKNVGAGFFLQTGSSKTGTVGYRDIGAAQHLDSGGASGPVAQLKQFNRGAPY